MPRTIFIALGSVLALVGSGCGESPSDNFAVGTGQLVLAPAPPGMCEGGGADKECNGSECAAPPMSSSPPSGSGSGSAGYSNSSGSPPPESFPSAPLPQSSGAGTGGYEPPPDPVADAGCHDLPDGGMSSECQRDAGVGMQAAALIAEDVPGCEDVHESRAAKLYLSTDDSNSMAGPAIARRLIESGQRVPAYLMRPYEFLNYYDFSFEPAAPGEVRMIPQLSSCPEGDRLSLQVALQAEARPASERAPLNVTFVLDTSGSMDSTQFGGPRPIELERAAVLAIAGQLRLGDLVSMVTWSTDQREILRGHEVQGPDDPALVNAANALAANGATDLHSGLVRGYGLAKLFYAPNRINRVVLISDGIANVGVTDEQLIGMHADDEEGEAGIYLAGIGVGDGVNDTLMNAVTDAGRGAYVYLDSLAEADRMLGERFLEVVDLAVREVRLEVTLPWYLTLEKFYGEVASTDPTKVRPQHLAPNSAMLFLQVLRACDASLLHGDDRILLRATWETPFEHQRRQSVLDTTLNALAGDDDALTKAAAIAGYAEALITADTTTSTEERRRALQKALDDVRAAKDSEHDPDLIEVARLLDTYLAHKSGTR